MKTAPLSRMNQHEANSPRLKKKAKKKPVRNGG
jgi:hypothetical protein